jgi:predicted amidophosphoribosyltransferase
VLTEVLALFAPPACAACRCALHGAQEVLCATCRRELPWLRGPRCPRCGLPGWCRSCPAGAAAYDRAWAPMAHEGVARELVAALKFAGALAVADLMAAQMAAGAPGELLAGTELVPVPAHPARRRARGFDHAEALAAALSRRTGRPVARCLRRGGAPARQLGAPRRARLAPGRLVFTAVASPSAAVLVDDVHTTGATLDACARALRAAGARRVACLTYARALRL